MKGHGVMGGRAFSVKPTGLRIVSELPTKNYNVLMNPFGFNSVPLSPGWPVKSKRVKLMDRES